MPDMSKWLADQPGTTGVWWRQQIAVVPSVAMTKFNAFATALDVYNFANNPGNLNALSASVSALIDAIPTGAARMPGRERVANLLPDGRLRNMMHSSTANAGKGESENLILALKNLMQALGGQLVPRNYQV
jgi:hypothetical protein